MAMPEQMKITDIGECKNRNSHAILADQELLSFVLTNRNQKKMLCSCNETMNGKFYGRIFTISASIPGMNLHKRHKK